jgi:hypothetical protein
MRGTRFLVPLFASALVASACGSSGGSSKADPTADLAVAKGAVLTKADLPAGFDSTPYSSSDDLPDSAKLALANCLNTKVSLFNDQPGEQVAHSDDFSQDNISISNEVDVYPKKSDVDPGYNALTNAKAPQCLSDLFKAAVTTPQTGDTTPPPTVGNITVTKLDVNSGDRSVGYRATIPLTTADGQTGTIYTDLFAAQKGRAVVNLIAQNINQPYDNATETALLNKVVGRLGNQTK